MENHAKLFDNMKDVIVVVYSKQSRVEEKPIQFEEEEEEEEGEEDDEEEEEKEEEKVGKNLFGAGVVINDKGYVLTCSHLVPRGFDTSIKKFGDKNSKEVEEFIREENFDLVILRPKNATAGNHKFCLFGSSKTIEIGMALFTISHPRPMVHSFMVGNIAYPQRKIKRIPFDHREFLPKKGSLIQINNFHGVSTSHGAPVFDSRGKVYGLILYSNLYDFALRPKPLKKFVNSCNEKLRVEEESSKKKRGRRL